MRPFPKLTARQEEVLEAIANHYTQHRVWPSYREVAAALDISSPNGIRCDIFALKKKGLLEWAPHSARSLRIPTLLLGEVS